jgi:hypothetical protein
MQPVENLGVRQLLELSQTNVTHDLELGKDYAVLAYSKSLLPGYSLDDPTASGEAAAKVALRLAQMNRPVRAVTDWLSVSRQALPENTPVYARDRAATEILAGRSLGLLALKGADSTELASAAFSDGEALLRKQHKANTRWDRYGTMLAHHSATFEAVAGNVELAKTMAVHGLWRALRAEKEYDGALKHGVFVAKHAAVSMVAGALGLTRSADRYRPLAYIRKKAAITILG